MPTLVDMEAATPKCPVIEKTTLLDAIATNRTTDARAGSREDLRLCARSMVWVAGHWQCSIHGRQDLRPLAAA